MKLFKTIFITLFLSHSLYSQEDIQQKIFTAKNKVFPALVHIQPVKELFSGGEKKKMQVTGSGIIISADGLVVTNNHVAEKANYVRCTLSSKDELEAEVIGLDPWTDLALLKLNLKDAGIDQVPYVEFGDVSEIEVGQIVLALGSPLGLARSLSMGVISSVERYFDDIGEMISPYNLWIQTDAAINPGNSGGPLINLDGKIIGINARAVVFGENLGFAIPVDIVKYVVDQIKEKGSVERSWIGVEWQELKQYRSFKGNADLQGVLVAGVEENSPAAKAGLEPGDIVLSLNNNKISAIHLEELPKVRLLISNLPVNSEIVFDVIKKNGSKEKIEMETELQGKFSGNEFNCEEWGISVSEITPRIMRNLQLDSDQGVLVSGVKVGSKAYRADVRRGYILDSINNEKIKDLDDFKEKYEKIEKSPGKSYMLFMKFGNNNRYALIQGENS